MIKLSSEIEGDLQIDRVDILLATYNGEKYLEEQLDSLLHQSYSNWRLIIKDDASTDRTLDILYKFAGRSELKNRVEIYESDYCSKSAKNNFFSMLKYCESEYIMFCDQDDIWLPDKIEITLELLKKTEEKTQRKCPVLVHTDLMVVDEQMNQIAKSFFKMQKLNPRRNKPNQIMTQNIVTGSTCMVNRYLIQMVKGNNKSIIMHDWWFALIASTFGEVEFLDRVTVKYRQHANNVLGTYDTTSVKYLLSRIGRRMHAKKILVLTCNQAEAFRKEFSEILPPQMGNMIKVYGDLINHNKISKVFYLIKYGFWKHSIPKRIGQIINI